MLQDATKVSQVFRATLALRPFGVVQEATLPLQAGSIEGFEDVEGGEEERAGTAGGVQDRDSGVATFAVAIEGMPEGAQELGALALSNDVPGEPLDVQVEGDKVVDLSHLAIG